MTVWAEAITATASCSSRMKTFTDAISTISSPRGTVIASNSFSRIDMARSSLPVSTYSNDPRATLCRVRGTRIAEMRTPGQGIRQDLVLVGRCRLGIVGTQRLQIRHSLRKTWQVVQGTRQEPLSELPNIVYQELFGAVDVFGTLPDAVYG